MIAARLGLVRAGRAVAAQNSLRCFATGQAQASPPQGDLVFDTFKEQQQQFQALLAGSKNLKPPLSGDEAAIKKYANDMEALRKKVGLPDHVEEAEAVLEYQLQAAHGDVHSFLSQTVQGQDLGDLEAVIPDIEQALDAADKAGGLQSDKGVSVFEQKIGEIQSKYGLESYNKIKDQAILEMYTEQVKSLRAKVVEDMDTVKRRDHLDFVQVDPSELKVKDVM